MPLLPERGRRTRTLALVLALAIVALIGAEPPAGAASAPATGTYENSSPAISFTGPWATATENQASGGSYARLSAVGKAKFTFVGTGIRWVTRTDSYSGIAKVAIDGKAVRKVDLYSATERERRVVYKKKWSKPGKHSISIARTGKRNAASVGRGITLDALVVTDSTPPPAMSRPQLAVRHTGVEVSWDASVAADVASYNLFRRDSTGAEMLLVTVPASDLGFFDVGLVAGASYEYRLTAVDSSGNTSPVSPSATTAMVKSAATLGRYANCPVATTTVSTAAMLDEALSKAAAGTVIRLEPGIYAGHFDITAHATAAHPAWVCGPRSAVIDPGDNTWGSGISLTDASHVIVTGLTVRHVQKGVLVSGGAYNVVSDMRITDIGDEAIHLRSNATDNTITDNTIERTGQFVAQFGEGVYVGSDPDAWCARSSCNPDRSDRNVIVGNRFSVVTAEGVDVKAGASGGEITGNVVNGSAMVASASEGLVVIKGNDWLVASNQGIAVLQNGFTATYSKANGWGRNNVFVRNQADLSRSAGFGVWVQKDIGNLVSCDNTASVKDHISNVSCHV